VKRIGYRTVFLAGLICLAFLTGCYTLGKDFEETSVKGLKIGKTTKNEILNTFDAAPYAKGIENDMETWTYSHYKFQLIGMTTWTKDLTIRFDENGVVKSYSYTNSWPPAY